METKSINELRGNPNNPRTISKTDYANLKQSLIKFGDLSGVVRNVRTDQLVGGHQRTEGLKELGNAQIEITQHFDPATEKGTVAMGYIVFGGERFSYREVDWDPAFENAANIAVNRIQGQFDVQALAEVTYQIRQEAPELLELTGQTEAEIKKLMKSVGVVEDEPEEPQQSPPEDETDDLTFRLTREQRDLVQSALEHVRITHDIPSRDGAAMNGSALYYIAQQYLNTSPPLPQADELPAVPQQDPQDIPL